MFTFTALVGPARADPAVPTGDIAPDWVFEHYSPPTLVSNTELLSWVDRSHIREASSRASMARLGFLGFAEVRVEFAHLVGTCLQGSRFGVGVRFRFSVGDSEWTRHGKEREKEGEKDRCGG